MWKLIPQKLMPPTRTVRYCCAVLKETGCTNRFIATGVRWDESTQRKNREEFEKIGATKATVEKFTSVMLMNDNDSRRRMDEHCMQKKKMVVNPIIDWKDSDVWEYINSENISTCELYQCGYDRVDEVVEQLERERRIAFLTLANAPDIPDVVYEKVSLCLDKAIEIVKSGAKQCEADTK